MPPTGQTRRGPIPLGTSRCVYCGHPLTPAQANKWPGVCGSHSDLPERDPNYMRALRERTS